MTLVRPKVIGKFADCMKQNKKWLLPPFFCKGEAKKPTQQK